MQTIDNKKGSIIIKKHNIFNKLCFNNINNELVLSFQMIYEDYE